MRALELPQSGEGIACGKFPGVARKNSRDERIEAVIDNFLAEVSADETGQSRIGGAHPRAREELAKNTQPRGQGKKRRREKSGRREWNGDEFSAANNKTLFCSRSGGDALVFQSEIVDQG